MPADTGTLRASLRLDDVSLTGPVPEASTTVSLGLLLVLGLSGLAVTVRRKAHSPAS